MHITNSELIEMAAEARKRAYAPYSNFAVGAALLTESGKVYLGANIENSAYTPTCCAERVAFFKAISDGERDFSAIAIVGGKKNACRLNDICAPCGVCRQVMREFCGDDFRVILGSGDELKELRLSELLPYGFSAEDLK